MLVRIKRLFNSYSTYFLQDPFKLQENRKKVDDLLFLKGYEVDQREIYLKAYDYFTYNGREFDGATMTEDLNDIEGLDLDAMLHDYLYIEYNVAGNYSFIWKADKLMRSEMKRRGKSTINAGLRFVLLLLKTLIGYPAFSFLFRGRRMTAEDKTAVDRIFTTLCTRKPKVWHQEFKGEIRWTLFFVILIVGYIWRVSLFDIVNSIKWLVS